MRHPCYRYCMLVCHSPVDCENVCEETCENVEKRNVAALTIVGQELDVAVTKGRLYSRDSESRIKAK